MKKFLSILLVCSSFVSSAQEINIIPQPLEVKQTVKGTYTLKKKITVSNLFQNNGKQTDNVTRYLSDYLKKYYGIEVVPAAKGSKADITLFPTRMPTGGSLAYRLMVSNSGIRIEANFDESAFHAVQSLIQLLPVGRTSTTTIPYVEIFDKPRFEYRGMHLDVGRHYEPVWFIKKYIDYLALHKLNTFHWHLTEDQGWRIEIKKYPELTTIGSKRNGTIIGRYPGKGSDNKPHEGFYTQQEIKEVVAYAKTRFVEVVPEIELPGHGGAAIAAYPWLSCFPEKPTPIPANMISTKSVEEQKNGRIKLVQETWGVFDDVFCAGKEETFKFLENVLDETIALFPSKYVHIGGDECPKTHWKQCPDCQKRMKDHNLKDEHELQSYFIQRIEKYLNAKGKTIIGWDEILEGGLAPNAQVMSWRGEAGGIAAAKEKHFVIMTPGNPVYFDHSQTRNEDSVTIGGYNSIQAVYAYDPVPKELSAEEGKYVRGAQANVWTEYMNNTSKIEYMIFPRMAALSEVLWTAKEKKNKEDFEKRLMQQFKRYELWKANYSRAYWQPEVKVIPSQSLNTVRWEVKVKNPGAIPVGVFREVKSEKLDTIPVYNVQGDVTHYEYKNQWKENIGYIDLKNSSIEINKSGSYVAYVCRYDRLGENCRNAKDSVTQTFIFSKSTGKKITITNPASKSYPGDGAFTLVNGVVNEKGLGRSSEFLGFSGTDCDAIIDLGSQQSFSNVTAHTFEQKASWIWPASALIVATSNDGTNFTTVGETKQTADNKISLALAATTARYLKVTVKNQGTISEDNAGASNKAWLFVSEIQVN
jgi:hexosaminidase